MIPQYNPQSSYEGKDIYVFLVAVVTYLWEVSYLHKFLNIKDVAYYNSNTMLLQCELNLIIHVIQNVKR